MKQVQIVVPFEKTEAVYDFLLDVLMVKNIMKFTSDNAHLLTFRIPDDAALETMEKLKSRGVGVEYGFIDILDLKASLPRESEEVREGRMQREATLAVEEIYENVKSHTSLSFDFLAFTIFAAAMAGFGLILNNVTIIVASMLLSPLMGPMLGVALGYVVQDRNLFVKGTVNELISLGLSLAIGVILALIMAVASPDFMRLIENDVSAGIYTEITRRGGVPDTFPFSPWDIGVAIFSGAAVAISVTKGDMSSLVGVAISAALMPPAVNAALMIVLGALTASSVGVTIGINSFLLLGMNIILIDVFAIVMFRIKRLTPMADKSATWRAVTKFRQTRSESLYHITNEESMSKPASAEQAAATFTPAPAVAAKPDESTDDSDTSKGS
ncbi:MAG: TIGR00341 family protein [Candidatus Thorarchaeota archaeon]